MKAYGYAIERDPADPNRLVFELHEGDVEIRADGACSIGEVEVQVRNVYERRCDAVRALCDELAEDHRILLERIGRLQSFAANRHETLMRALALIDAA